MTPQQRRLSALGLGRPEEEDAPVVNQPPQPPQPPQPQRGQGVAEATPMQRQLTSATSMAAKRQPAQQTMPVAQRVMDANDATAKALREEWMGARDNYRARTLAEEQYNLRNPGAVMMLSGGAKNLMQDAGSAYRESIGLNTPMGTAGVNHANDAAQIAIQRAGLIPESYDAASRARNAAASLRSALAQQKTANTNASIAPSTIAANYGRGNLLNTQATMLPYKTSFDMQEGYAGLAPEIPEAMEKQPYIDPKTKQPIMGENNVPVSIADMIRYNTGLRQNATVNAARLNLPWWQGNNYGNKYPESTAMTGASQLRELGGGSALDTLVYKAAQEDQDAAPGGSWALGGTVSTDNPGSAMGLAAGYREYVSKAMEAGVQPIPYDKYMSMKGATGPATEGVEAYADGGVVATGEGGAIDMAAGVDQVAATTGEKPAKISEGEFIIPTHAVMFYGTKFLDGLIKKAEGGTNGAGQQPESSGSRPL